MVNFNGNLSSESVAQYHVDNRGYKYGDGLFETLKVINGKLLFWEDHYFRLMASMRILRIDIPMNFTMEFLEAEIIRTLEANNLQSTSARVRFSIDRGDGGKYLPSNTKVNYSITAELYPQPFYTVKDQKYIVDLYKDFMIAPGLLSGLKTNNKVLQVMGSVYAKENDFDNCLVLNTNKSVIEALNGNLFLVKGNVVKTPPLEDGCLRGIMRKQIIDIITSDEHLELIEESISPFELQKADELFVTNVIVGIQSISQYRKKQYTNTVAKACVNKLNIKIRLS